MNTFKSAALVITGLALGAGSMALTAMCTPPADPAVEETVYPNITLTPCAQEDSINCYWDAATMGNGQGSSFVNLDGTLYYPESR